MDSKKLVYVAHPYDGDENNKKNVERIIAKLVRDYSNVVPVSPIHNYGYMYDKIDYMDGMRICLNLLAKCDELWLAQGWTNSKGCCIEYAFALGKNIPIYYL